MPRKPVTVSLPQDVVRAAGRFCRRRSRTMSEVVRDAVKDYLFRQDFEEARGFFTAKMQKLGIFSERDLIGRLENAS